MLTLKIEIGPFPAPYFRLLNTVLVLLIVNVVADCWVRTTDVWRQKWPLYQLRHGHRPRLDFLSQGEEPTHINKRHYVGKINPARNLIPLLYNFGWISQQLLVVFFSFQTDIYPFGLIYYKMIFPSTTDMEVARIRDVLPDQFEPCSMFRLFRDMMSLEPNNRPGADDIIRRCDEIILELNNMFSMSGVRIQ